MVEQAPTIKKEQQQQSPREQFLDVNQARLTRAQNSLSQRKRIFLDLLPMLLHLNTKSLPGYVTDAPCGIVDYTPNEKSLTQAKNTSKDPSVSNQLPSKFDLLGLYFMGSPGTIAYSGQSDFDIWVFVNDALTKNDFDKLIQKTQEIEQWAKDVDIEAHFFVIKPERFRAGETLPLSSESSGSTQYGLLLDEFYRSSLMIAGLPLTWWLVPPEYETQFDDYITSQKHIRDKSGNTIEKSINLGPLTTIEQKEYFSASVWHLTKGLTSPYKTAIKLLLIESYAHDPSGVSLISHHLKEKVYCGNRNLNEIDPWLLMYYQIEMYLTEQKDSLRLNILRRSFYLKVRANLSKNQDDTSWKYTLLRKLTSSWGWEQSQLSDLDNRDNWKVETIANERTELSRVFTQSYRLLSRFKNESADTEKNKISDNDLSILGRRIFSAFERKSGKIDIINRGISPNISEKTISLHLQKVAPNHVNINDGTPVSWVLYRGIVPEHRVNDSSHIKRASSLIEMLTWCYFNQILSDENNIMLYLRNNKSYCEFEIKSILAELKKQFPLDLVESSEEGLKQPVKLKKVALFINCGEISTSVKSDKIQISSSRNNALSFGAQRKSLVTSYDLVFITTWGELFIKRYIGKNALIECISEYLSWAPPSQLVSPEEASVHCYSPAYGKQIKTTIKNIFDDFRKIFFHASDTCQGRYLVEVENHYQSISIENDLITHKILYNKEELLNYLGKSSIRFSPVFFSEKTLVDSILPNIYKHNKADTLQLFFIPGKNIATVYILDEKGAIYIQQTYCYSHSALIEHYQLFAKTVLERVSLNNLSAIVDNADYHIELYEIDKNHKSYDIKKIDNYNKNTNAYLSLQVMCDRENDLSERITIFCNDVEFSTLQYDKDIYAQVAKMVMKFRGSQETYPVYITDIDLSHAMLNSDDNNLFQSHQFFRYKNKIESELTNALKNL